MIETINEAKVGTGDPAPQEDEKKSTVMFVNDMLQRFKLSRQRFDQSWQPNYEFLFGGKQWTINRPSWRFSEVVNLVWANCMTEVGIQTDTRPKVEFKPVENSDYAFAKQLQKVNECNWTKFPWLQRIQEMVLLTKWVHVAHASIEWNSELGDGLGDIDFKILDPFYCYWDPYATDEASLRSFIYAAPVPTGELKLKYPEFADKIKADIDTFEANSSHGNVVSTTSDRIRLTAEGNTRTFRDVNRFGGEPMTFLVRVWTKDNTQEEVEATKEDGSAEYVRKLKYPQGRYIEMCNNFVLFDGPNGVFVKDKFVPYEDGNFPIARLVNYSYPMEYAGECEVTHLRGPQKVFNYMWSHSLDQMKNAGSPKIIIGASSGIDPDNVSNEPGQKIVANDVNQIKFEPGSGLATGMQFIMDQAKFAFDNVSGLHDATKGAVDPSISSGLLFESYAEAAQVRMRLKNRNLDVFLQRVGQLMLARYLQFYTAPRVFRITNDQGFPEFVEFFISKDEMGKKIANVGTEQGMLQSEIKGVPDVEIITGSALPFAKALKNKTVLEYVNAGLIDQEEALKTVDWPNYDSVVQRMAKVAQANAEAEQQQKGMK